MKDYLNNDSGWKAGDRVIAFDSCAWENNGGDTETNEEFWVPATIVKVYREKADEFNKGELRVLCSLEWDHNQKTTHGHFLNNFRRIDESL